MASHFWVSKMKKDKTSIWGCRVAVSFLTGYILVKSNKESHINKYPVSLAVFYIATYVQKKRKKNRSKDSLRQTDRAHILFDLFFSFAGSIHGTPNWICFYDFSLCFWVAFQAYEKKPASNRSFVNVQWIINTEATTTTHSSNKEKFLFFNPLVLSFPLYIR